MTHEDVPDELKYGGMVQDRRLFVKEKVLWEGDVVAAVAAITEEIAARAVALIEVEYEPLAPVVDFEAALADDVPLVHDDWESDEGDETMGRDRNRIGYSTIVKGDADAAMASADVVVRGRYVADCSQGVPIEPRAVVAQWQQGARSGRRHRFLTRRGPAWRAPCRFRSRTSGSSFLCWEAASARSAISTSKVALRLLPEPHADP